MPHQPIESIWHVELSEYFTSCDPSLPSFTLEGMRYRPLGKTGFQASEVSFGGLGIGGNAFGQSYGATDDATALSALNRAYELGCNLFDTADVYGHGHSETLIGQALKGWQRDEIFIATSVGQDFSESAQAKAGGIKPNFSAEYIRKAVDASLHRLGIEGIDLYQLHTPPLEVIQHGQVFDVLRELKQQGKIRFYGIAIHDPQEGIQAIQHGQVDAVQAVYNLFDHRLENQLLALCAQTGTALMAREPLARGFLSGQMNANRSFEPGDIRAIWPKPLIQKRIQAANQFKSLIPQEYASLAQFAISYPLAHSAVSTVLAGCKTPAQVEENMAVGNLPPLSSATLEALAKIQAVL